MKSNNTFDPNLTRAIKLPGRLYQLHADLLERSAAAISPEEGLTEKLFRRHLTRLQRAVATFHGSIVSQSSQSLLATFASAEHAVLSACEMQHSCAAIPLPSGLNLYLRIGVHALRTGNAGDANLADTEGLIAASLANMLTDRGVLFSSDVYQDIPEPFQQCTSRLEQTGNLLAVHSLAWQSPNLTPQRIKPTPAKGEESIPAKEVRLILRHGIQVLKFRSEDAIVKIGRDLSNDVVVRNPEASRNHCQIIFRNGLCHVVDLSTNGTYVTTRLGETAIVNRTKKLLQGRGWLTFGDPYQQSAMNCVEFELKPAG